VRPKTSQTRSSKKLRRHSAVEEEAEGLSHERSRRSPPPMPRSNPGSYGEARLLLPVPDGDPALATRVSICRPAEPL
jgi:hypothetical protein